MKILKQIAIIGGISFIGELLNVLLPLPVPGSVYGLAILLTCLISGLIKLEQIEDTAEFLITIMPVMFISPIVSVMTIFGDIKNSLLAIFTVAFVSTIVVMIVTGLVAQFFIRLKSRREAQDNE